MISDDKETLLGLYRTMVRIRTFEEMGATLSRKGELAGSLHLYSGEEAVAAGVCSCLTDRDYVTSTHRGHGHCIAKGADTGRMMAELFGKATGYSKGKGGSMHIADASKGVIGANGIVGAGLPIAVGAGFAQKYKGEDTVTVAFFGDGATNRGTFHEAMNFAAALQLPVVFVCENNNYGMSTPFSTHSHNKTVAQRAQAYDMPGVRVDGNDVLTVREAAAEAVSRARTGGGPSLSECMTWRYYGHFLGDRALYKDPEEDKAWHDRDPIPAFEKRLLGEGLAAPAELEQIKAEAEREIQEAVEFAKASPYPAAEVMFEDLYVWPELPAD
jgi:pyruvate dehydrogenase E1 component alpha subunit